MNWSVRILKWGTAIYVLLLSTITFSQPPAPPPGGTDTGDPPCWEPECVPVDSGIIFLILAGALLGAKIIYNQRIKSRA